MKSLDEIIDGCKDKKVYVGSPEVHTWSPVESDPKNLKDPMVYPSDFKLTLPTGTSLDLNAIKPDNSHVTDALRYSAPKSGTYQITSDAALEMLGLQRKDAREKWTKEVIELIKAGQPVPEGYIGAVDPDLLAQECPEYYEKIKEGMIQESRLYVPPKNETEFDFGLEDL